MIKQAPSVGRVLAMVMFTLSCFGLLLFLWLAFGGSIPLRPEGYRFKAVIPEATTLPTEADVRVAGVAVGKVKTKEFQRSGKGTLVEIELKKRFAPISRDAKVMLRQKTLFGESYLELAPGRRGAGTLPDGATLPDSHVGQTVQLDEIFNAFDRPTREAFQRWMLEIDRAFSTPRSPGQASRALNDALGNLDGFADEGSDLLEVLDEQEGAVRRLVRNTGRVSGALARDQGTLRNLIVNSRNTFEATASRHERLAETFAVFPTFLDESRVTLGRLERFAHATRPLVHDLHGPARALRPTLRDLRGLSPDLKLLFGDLDRLTVASRTGLPATTRTLRGADPLVTETHPWFAELNPILAFLSFNQRKIAAFLSNGLSNLVRGTTPTSPWSTQNGIIDSRSFQRVTSRPAYDRGNAYVSPNAYDRAIGLGTIENFTCPGDKEVREPSDPGQPGGDDAMPPCFIQPPSLFQNQQFPRLEKGKAPIVPAPMHDEGNGPAHP